VRDVDGRRAGALEERHQNAATAIRAHQAGLRGKAVANLRDIADGQRGAIHRPDRERGDVTNGVGAAVQAYEELLIPKLGGPGRQHEVLRLDGVAHVVGREAERVEPREIDVDHHLPLLAAVRERHLRPLHGGEARPEKVAREVEELLFGERVGVDGPLEDRHVRGAVIDDERRSGPHRQELDECLRDGGDLRVRHLHLRTGMEEDLGHRHPEERLALDVLDPGDGRRETALVKPREALLHFLRSEPAVLPHHGDHRDVDLGQDVRRHLEDRVDPPDDDEHRHDDKGVRAPQRKADDPHRINSRF